MKKNILKGAGVLAACALLAKVIGALYRIPLTNVLGAEGIGLYQMVFPLYTVLLTVSSGGLPVAISKAVAVRGEREGRAVIRCALVSLLAAGSLAMLAIVIFRKFIAGAQGNGAAALAYLGIAPSLVFVAVISCFRGYFQGRQNMLPTALSQLTEQLVKLGAGLVLARVLMPLGVEYGVLGSVLGVTLSEFVAMSALLGHYLLHRRKQQKREGTAEASPSDMGESPVAAATAIGAATAPVSGATAEIAAELTPAGISAGAETPALATAAALDSRAVLPRRRRAVTSERKKVMREIYRVAVPVTLGSLVLPLTQVLDSLLVVNILSRVGSSLEQATALYGLVTGPVNSLLNMPTVITLSLSGALLPRISGLFARGESVAAASAKAMRTAVAAGLIFTLGLALGAEIGMRILYARGLRADELKLGGALLRLGSISVLYVSILQVATAVLQGCDRAHIPAVNLMIGAGVKVAATALLLPLFGIAGAVAATVACYAVTCLLDVIALKKYVALQ